MAGKETELTKRKALMIYAHVEKHYVKGRHDRSLNWVWRTKVYPEYPCTIDNFFKMLRLAKRILAEQEKQKKTGNHGT
jgi:hypothetical protein